MRYPVRCLRCSQRQLVSFTVAGISVPSHVKQRRARQMVAQHKNWSEPIAAARAEQESQLSHLRAVQQAESTNHPPHD